MSAAPAKPPITCHVLNTVTGLPAANVPVSLTLLRPFGPSKPLTAVTNTDGRVNEWGTPSGGPSLQEIFANAREHGVGNAISGSSEETQRGRPGAGARRGSVQEELAMHTGESGDGGPSTGVMVWALTFDIGEYFEGEGFWTEVEIRFKTEVVSNEQKDQPGSAAVREHWHVPLLLSPWSYTTYRGS